MSGLLDSGNKGGIFDNNSIFDNSGILDQGQNKSIFQKETIETVDNDEAQRRAAEAAAKASYKATAEQAESLRKAKEYRAGHDAGRAGSVAASIATAKQAEQLRKMNEAMKAASGGARSTDPAKEAAIIEKNAPSDVQEVRQEAMNEQANANKQENEMYLPNTDVKSDYTKWLIFGALGLAALYILKGGKK